MAKSTNVPGCKMVGPKTLHVDCDAKTLESRSPFVVDGMVCTCGCQTFRLGLAQTSNPCPTCRSHVLHQCQGCEKWFCTNCLAGQIVKWRKQHGQEVVGGEVQATSN